MGGTEGPGVKAFSLQGRFHDVRRRVFMTDEERRWRAQFLKDIQLADGEPRYVPEYYRATTNPIRRLWKSPMWVLQSFLQSKLVRHNNLTFFFTLLLRDVTDARRLS